jgi:hypothetical protein
MAPPPGGGKYTQYQWQQWDLSCAKEAAEKAAEALVQANDVGRNNRGALETRFQALETRFHWICAFHKGKLEEHKCVHQELMALAERDQTELEQQLRMQQEEHHRELQQKYDLWCCPAWTIHLQDRSTSAPRLRSRAC